MGKAAKTSGGEAKKVIRRESIYKVPSIIVEAIVPAHKSLLQEVLVQVGQRSQRCVKFIQSVAGGHVSIYVHRKNPNEKVRGKKITAAISIWQEEYDDGRSFLAVHLIETESRATHRWKIVQQSKESLPVRYLRRQAKIIEMLPPLRGCIVIMRRAS